jgi:hypothetical protein
MNEEFRKLRARAVRAMAEKADPFTKRRLLDLAARYETAFSTGDPTSDHCHR